LVLFPDERKQVGVEWLLKLTGEDDVDFRENYTKGDAKRFAGTIAIASNNAIFAGDTTGIDRRLDLIPFQNIIPGNQRDPDLQEKLKAEVPDLVSVVLSIPLSLVDDLIAGKGIGKMPDIRWHEWQMKLEVDKVASFADEMLVEEEWGSEPAQPLFDSYLEWSRKNNHTSPGSNTFFGGRLKKHLDWIGWKWEKVKSNGKFTYKGFRLRREGEDTPTISDRLLPSGTVQPSPRDSSGIVLNPVGARDRDSREGFPPKTFEKSEVTEIPEMSRTAQPVLDVSEKNKEFPLETIPTIPIPALERVSDYPQTVTEGQCKPSLTPDYSTYPHLTCDTIEAKRNQAHQVKERLLGAGTKEELTAVRKDYSTRCDWVWKNLLTKSQQEKLTEIATTKQLNLLDATLSPVNPIENPPEATEGEINDQTPRSIQGDTVEPEESGWMSEENIAGFARDLAQCDSAEELDLLRSCWNPQAMNAACKRLSPEKHAQIMQWTIELNQAKPQ